MQKKKKQNFDFEIQILRQILYTVFPPNVRCRIHLRQPRRNFSFTQYLPSAPWFVSSYFKDSVSPKNKAREEKPCHIFNLLSRVARVRFSIASATGHRVYIKPRSVFFARWGWDRGTQALLRGISRPRNPVPPVSGIQLAKLASIKNSRAAFG